MPGLPLHSAPSHSVFGSLLASPFVVNSLIAVSLAVAVAPAWALAATPALVDVQHVYKTAGAAEALRRVGVLIAQHPDDAGLRFQQGVMLAEQHRDAEAIKVFQKLTHDFPDMPEAFNNLAVLYAEQGQIDKAGATLEQALRTRPNYGTAFDNLRSTYSRMAGRAYAKALQIQETPAAPKLSLIQELYEPPAPPSTFAAAAASSPSTIARAASVAPPPILVARAPAPAVVPPAPAPTSAPAPAPTPVVAAASVPKTPVPAPTIVAAASTAKTPPTGVAAASVAKPPAPPPTQVATAASLPAPAAAKASTPASAVKPTAVAAAKPVPPASKPADDAQQIRAAVNDWAKAWERKDMNGYFAAYAPGFKGTDASSAAWQTARRARILGKKRINVEVSGISVSIDKGVARATFRQDYAADQLRFSNQKTLQLVERNGKWLIDKEVAGS